MLFAFLSLLFGSVETLLMDYFFRIYDPVIFIAVFYVFAFLVTLMLALKKRDEIRFAEAIENKKLLSLFIGSSAAANGLWFTSLYLMGSHGIVVMSILQRAFVLYYSTRYMGERMTKIQYALSGFIILCTVAFSSQGTHTELLGGLLCLISYVLFAVNDITQKKVSSRVTWQTAMTLRQFAQCLVFVVIGLSYCGYKGIDLADVLSVPFVLSVFVTSMCGAVLGKLFHFQALRRAPLSRVLLIEQLRAAVVFGGAVIVFGAISSSVQLVAGLGMIMAVLWIAYEDYRAADKSA